MFWALKEKCSDSDWENRVKDWTPTCEHVEGNDADVLLPDAGIVVLQARTRYREDTDGIQVGEAGLEGLRIGLIGHTGKSSQCHFGQATVLVVGLDLELGAHLGSP